MNGRTDTPATVRTSQRGAEARSKTDGRLICTAPSLHAIVVLQARIIRQGCRPAPRYIRSDRLHLPDRRGRLRQYIARQAQATAEGVLDIVCENAVQRIGLMTGELWQALGGSSLPREAQ